MGADAGHHSEPKEPKGHGNPTTDIRARCSSNDCSGTLLRREWFATGGGQASEATTTKHRGCYLPKDDRTHELCSITKDLTSGVVHWLLIMTAINERNTCTWNIPPIQYIPRKASFKVQVRSSAPLFDGWCWWQGLHHASWIKDVIEMLGGIPWTWTCWKVLSERFALG